MSDRHTQTLYLAWEERWRGSEERERLTVLGRQIFRSKKAALQAILPKLSPTSVIEVGCGLGHILSIYHRAGIPSYGIDISESAVRVCRDKGLNAEVKNVEQEHQRYDLVSSDGMLEHFLNFEPMAEQLMRLSYRHVLLIQPNHGSFWGKTLPYLSELILGDENVLEYNYRIADFVEVFDRKGFDIVMNQPVFGDVFRLLVFQRRPNEQYTEDIQMEAFPSPPLAIIPAFNEEKTVGNTEDIRVEAFSSPPLAIIPAFNEEKTVGKVVSRLLELQFSVVVIDDCSIDGTSAVAEQAGAVVLRHPTNLGYGCALQTGYKYALHNGFERVVQLDGDGQHDPDSALELLEKLKSENYDVVIGTRFFKGGTYRAPLMRRLGHHYFCILFNMLTDMEITDPTSGLQALSKRVIHFYCTSFFPDDYPDTNVLMLLHRKGFNVIEVPVHMHPSTNKSMHSGVFKPIYYFIRMTLSMFISIILRIQKDS